MTLDFLNLAHYFNGSWMGYAWFGGGVLVIWSLVWKGLALWRAAERKEKWWFIALLVINTLGILEILYLYVFSKKESSS
jgi:hypothetical protein